jgi:hypothetical protein
LDCPCGRVSRRNRWVDRSEQTAHIDPLAIPDLDRGDMLITTPIVRMANQIIPQLLLLLLQAADRCHSNIARRLGVHM